MLLRGSSTIPEIPEPGLRIDRLISEREVKTVITIRLRFEPRDRRKDADIVGTYDRVRATIVDRDQTDIEHAG